MSENGGRSGNRDAAIVVAVVVIGFVLYGMYAWRTPGESTAAPRPASTAEAKHAPRALPTILAQKEFVMQPSGTGLILSVREPAAAADVQALIAQHAGFSKYYRVRVFAYDPGARPGEDKPAALWEWEPGGELQRRY